MNIQSVIEKTLLIITASLCILISILDFTGALDSIPWISQRIPIMMLLAIGLMAVYMISERNQSLLRLKDLKKIFIDGNNKILNKIELDVTNQEIIERVNFLWKAREDIIRELFDQTAINTTSGDPSELISYLENCFINFNKGKMFETEVRYPWDFTITAINLKGNFIYHPVKELISYPITKKNPKKNPYPEILQRRTGEFIWINETSSEQFRSIFDDPHFDKVRFTKIYFRELSHLKAIIVFESHLNILFHLPKQKIEDIINK